MAFSKNKEKTCNLPVLGSVEEMYETGLGDTSLFTGGFINFGYWTLDKLDSSTLFSEEDRLQSEKNLYLLLADQLNILPEDIVLEVGCGLGIGSRLIAEKFCPKNLYAIDFSKSQIDRALALNEHYLNKNRKLSFAVGKAELLNFDNKSINKIYTIEAAQHFSSLNQFFQESYRVLNNNGKLGIATFFASSSEGAQMARELIPTVQCDIDRLHPILVVKHLLDESGFRKVKIESIGDNVWKGFDRWVSQGEHFESWDRNWYRGYKKCFFDYYSIIATK